MYAFRKPFAAGTYEGRGLVVPGLDVEIELKTGLVISQIIGYAMSKLLGIKFCSEAARAQRGWYLLSLILIAEVALVLFAVLPDPIRPWAMFLNGLPLGMVWGFVLAYLEGRRMTEPATAPQRPAAVSSASKTRTSSGSRCSTGSETTRTARNLTFSRAQTSATAKDSRSTASAL